MAQPKSEPKKKSKPVTMRSVSFRAQARLEWLRKREKRLADRIVKLEKQAESLPKRIAELKTKLKQTREQLETSLKTSSS